MRFKFTIVPVNKTDLNCHINEMVKLAIVYRSVKMFIYL